MIKFKNILVLFIIGFSLDSCGPNSSNLKESDLKPVDIVLNENDLFSGVKIFEFLKNTKISKEEGKENFLKGLDFFKNKKDLVGAKKFFIKSILNNPSGVSYYELGNLFLESKEYDSAIKAYGMAEQLDYEPFSKVLYNLSCVYSLMDKIDLSGQYLEYSIEAGYSNLEQIALDSDLSNLRNESFTYNFYLKKALNGVSKSENLFWLNFKKLFSKSNLPILLDPNIDHLVIDNLDIISYDYEKYISEMRDEEFSREVSKSFYYFTSLKETSQYVALVYLVKDEYLGSLAPVAYRLVTFTHEGKLIDKKVIAGRALMNEPMKVASIDQNLNLTIDYFDFVYTKNTDEAGYDDNPIISKNKIKSETFKISENGSIQIVN